MKQQKNDQKNVELHPSVEPDQETTDAVERQWHKMLAIVMHKAGKNTVVITPENIKAFSEADRNNVIVREKNNKLVITLVSDDTARLLDAIK